ncbi:hypothetical protein [Agromyces sp. NPDC057865]|uniref:hypothetical protein n=1 Tax=Agromyces sp. NPDC057865 TaxID=3346267 RepID=UPI00366FD555
MKPRRLDADATMISRRALLGLGAAAVLSVGIATTSRAEPATALPTRVRTAKAAAPAEPRYRFAVKTPVPDLAPLARLEEVWAAPYYLAVTDCTVSYVGATEFRLTAEESAIVDVVESVDGPVADRETTYLTVLAASTRIPPANLDAKLRQLGRGIVAGSLALAPQAPQARAFAAWLEATA